MMKTKPMLIFDLDGTLWDSAEGVAASWNELILQEDPSLPLLTPEDIHGIMGLTMPEIARRLLPGLREERRMDFFNECAAYEVDYLRKAGGMLFPGMAETLNRLHEAGYPMAVVSNCQKDYVAAFLDYTGLRSLMTDYEEWGRTGLDKGSNIRLVMERNGIEKAVYIGDTAGDEKAARKAGIPFIHAAYGFGRAENPEAVISNLAELPAAVESMTAPRLIFIGSSVCEGYGATDNHGWSAYLAEALTERGWQVSNCSIGGQTTADILLRLEKDVLVHKPDVCVVGLGLANEGLSWAENETEGRIVKGIFESNLKKITESIQKAGIKVMLGGVYPNSQYTPLQNTLLRECAAEMDTWGVTVFHWLDAVGDEQGHFRPGLEHDPWHPNDEGYRVMFEQIGMEVFE